MRRGFTLVELIVCMAITGIIAAALVLLVDEARTDARRSAAHLRWVGAANTAFAQIGRDVRAGESIAITPAALQVGDLRWTVVDGTLRRGAEIFARDVAQVKWTQAAGLLNVELDFVARYGTHHAQASHATRVALRRAP